MPAIHRSVKTALSALYPGMALGMVIFVLAYGSQLLLQLADRADSATAMARDLAVAGVPLLLALLVSLWGIWSGGQRSIGSLRRALATASEDRWRIVGATALAFAAGVAEMVALTLEGLKEV